MTLTWQQPTLLCNHLSARSETRPPALRPRTWQWLSHTLQGADRRAQSNGTVISWKNQRRKACTSDISSIRNVTCQQGLKSTLCSKKQAWVLPPPLTGNVFIYSIPMALLILQICVTIFYNSCSSLTGTVGSIIWNHKMAILQKHYGAKAVSDLSSRLSLMCLAAACTSHPVAWRAANPSSSAEGSSISCSKLCTLLVHKSPLRDTA